MDKNESNYMQQLFVFCQKIYNCEFYVCIPQLYVFVSCSYILNHCKKE